MLCCVNTQEVLTSTQKMTIKLPLLLVKPKKNEIFTWIIFCYS